MTGTDEIREGRGGVATAESRWYFDALREGRLDVRRCATCGHWSPPVSELCSSCGADALVPVPTSGTGSIISAVRDHRAGTTLVVVELEEGPWIAAALHEAGSDAAIVDLIGQRVALQVLSFTEGEPIPAFSLVTEL